MGLEQDIRSWCDLHPRARDFFKQGVVWAIGWLAAATAGGNGFVGLAVAAGFGWLAAHVHANTSWLIVGAKAPSPARDANGKFKPQ